MLLAPGPDMGTTEPVNVVACDAEDIVALAVLDEMALERTETALAEPELEGVTVMVPTVMIGLICPSKHIATSLD